MEYKQKFRPRKRLGQNFLIDKNIQRKIIQACQITPEDVVLEIGAGRGELTRSIAQVTQRLSALEIDPYLYAMLKSNLAGFSRVKLIKQDILDFNISRYFKDSAKIKVIGNLPYSITTPIIAHLLKFHDKIKFIFITVQKEFARRMTAIAGTSDWSALSCFLQYHSEPRILFLIKKTCFLPQPKVDSAFVRLRLREEFPLDNKRERQLFKIIRLSFQQRRKTLRNALTGAISNQRLNRYFNQYNIDRNIRGEQLSLRDFINLVNVN
jgi:16S rRNA (adenine1518-N6/adenine1519-N6)-dimethyltransferase